MNRLLTGATVALALAVSTAANAITVDGTLDAGYGAAKARVSYQEDAPTSNFGSPTAFTDRSSYDIYLTSDADNVYGFLRAAGDRPIEGTFANLYFNSDMTNGNNVGSDIGFNLSDNTATGTVGIFVPNESRPVQVGGVTVRKSTDGLGLEFAIANSLFTTRTAGITYDAGFVDPTVGSTIQLRLSQSFGYSVGGGASYGAARLGQVTLGGNAVGDVPEPATWGTMILGFALVGTAARRRRTRQALA